jgi:2-polyprenyl-3-methyl-5-hydroxy-6-metoxy-1,4-benzoquinol methylase
MSEVRSIIENYGWRDQHETCAHDYIKQAIIEILNRLHLQRIMDLGCGNGAL